MNKRTLAILSLLVACGTTFAATNYVIPGDDFQGKLDAAAPGDTFVILAGPYTNDLNFRKPVTVLRSGTNDLIRFVGNVQINGTGSVSFAQCKFSSVVPIQCTGTVSFSQCSFLSPVTSTAATLLLSQVGCSNGLTANLMSSTSGTNLQAYDSTFTGPNTSLNVIGGKVLLKRSLLMGLSLSNNAALEALRITNYGNAVSANSSAGSGIPFIVVQSHFETQVSLAGYKAWLGYNYLATYPFNLTLANCDSVLIGNKNIASGTILLVVGGTFKAFNNLMYAPGGATIGIQVDSCVAEIINNTIVPNGDGIYVSGGVGPITLRGNIIEAAGSGYAIESLIGAQSMFVSYCDLYGGPLYPPDMALVNCLNVNPLLFTPPDYSLQPGSPCMNAGPPEAIYNDRDGSRNDMGYTGGPLWNPANYTNNNPMIFFSTLMPQIVLKGGRTNIQVNAAASAGH